MASSPATKPSAVTADHAAVAARRNALGAELSRFVGILAIRGDVRRVWVFGSLARGETGPWSDIDLLVVQETPYDFYERRARLLGILRPRVGLDLIVLTPVEFEAGLVAGNRYLLEILAHGRALHEA